MIFNSFEFALFLPFVFVLYWFILNKNQTIQNCLLIAAGYFFYGWWDWRFLSLLFLSSLADYLLGLAIGRSENKKPLLILSIVFNLSLLGFFKYFNFFISSFIYAFSTVGIHLEGSTLNIVLPVGISFYTFQSLSYTIDVYRGKMEPTNKLIDYFAFVAFFPQLLAGPIERAANLLPQFSKKRIFDYNMAADGIKQMLWGFFKKIVIADNCGRIVNEIFANYDSESGSTLLLGAIFFAFQIYCDFSGYSDIAIGCAKLFGFNLMKNFNFPYFSRDVAEFWRRWHISLSSWFRDYLFIPLGGSRGTVWKNIRNILIVFTLSGLWHGASWTFIIWGGLNALYFIPLILVNNQRQNTEIVAEGKLLPSLKELLQMFTTFTFITLAWIFFRAESVSKAWLYLTGIFNSSIFSIPSYFEYIPYILLIILIEWLNRDRDYVLKFEKYPLLIRWGIYYSVILIIMFLGEFGHNEFIYFQF